MKGSNLTTWFGRILIGAGIVIFAGVIYQIIFQGTPPASAPRPRPRAAPAQPRPRPVESAAALKEVAAHLSGLETPAVEGFAGIDSFSHSGQYDSWDGKVRSWWQYSDREGDRVAWRTAPVPEEGAAVLVFSGALGTAAGEAGLQVNGRPVLDFNTGVGPENEEWEGDGYRLKFFSILVKANGERHGIFVLTVPEGTVETGQPLTLSAQARGYEKSGPGNSFFMLNPIPDTLKRLSAPDR